MDVLTRHRMQTGETDGRLIFDTLAAEEDPRVVSLREAMVTAWQLPATARQPHPAPPEPTHPESTDTEGDFVVVWQLQTRRS